MNSGFSLQLTPGQLATREQLHKLSVNVLRTQAASAESDGVDLGKLAGQLEQVGLSPEVLIQQGIDDPHTLLVAAEELAYGDAGIAWAVVQWFQLATVLIACASPAQRQRAASVFAAEPAAGVRILMYEDFGRQPTEFETTVAGSHDQGWIATGHKSSVSSPDAGGLSLLFGRDGDELAAFAFAGHRSQLVTQRDDLKVGKLAITAIPSGSVAIEGLELTPEERLGGGVALHRALGQARLHLAAVLVGVTRASVEYCAAYAVHRTTWKTPLAQHQGVSLPLVEHSTELEEVRLLIWDVAARLNGLDDVDDIEATVARAVNRASSLALRATRDGVQLIGVRAITRELPAERWYRSAAVLGATDFDVLATAFGLS